MNLQQAVNEHANVEQTIDYTQADQIAKGL